MLHRKPLWVFAVLGGAAASLAYAQPAGEETATADTPANTWQPPEIEAGRYDDIVAYNIFQPDRAALAAEAQRQPEPVIPDEPEPIEPVVELPPPDPDASLVLVGVSIHGSVATAHIEDRASGEIIVLNEAGPFSEGKIEAITMHGLTYVVAGETRHIKISQTLTGETPQAQSPAARPIRPAGNTPTSPATPSGAEPNATPPSDGLTDLERRMRERRNSE
ncbi:MAG: hypothetical protein ACIAXF_02985 [Phycisphaerales bacterium JB063]